MTTLPDLSRAPIPEPLILLIEDEPPMRRFLRVVLTGQGYRLVEADTGASGVTQAAMHNPDLVLLDLGLPDLDGREVIRRLREWSLMPILVLSARGRETDKVDVLDAGADDYLTKPFGAGELLARIRVALRNAARAGRDLHEQVLSFGTVAIDLVKRQVRKAGVDIHLTPLEYKLLVILVQNPGRVLTHRQLLKDVWGPGQTSQTHYLRVYMAQLRQKLEDEPARPRFFQTEPGVGYRLTIE